ncbi:MAG TPA: DUF378 domain-containing protein [Candidatus Paceibacterota bacterium]|nr:DUF378 domain-containing protein [Candidatus Paceibacterota bacterium]
MKSLHGVSFWLVIIGGLNWGLVALGQYMGSNFNIVNLLFGSIPTLENLVYLLVGLAAVSLLFTHKQTCRQCNPSAVS